MPKRKPWIYLDWICFYFFRHQRPYVNGFGAGDTYFQGKDAFPDKLKRTKLSIIFPQSLSVLFFVKWHTMAICTWFAMQNEIQTELRLQPKYTTNQYETNSSNSAKTWSVWGGAYHLPCFNTWGAKSNIQCTLGLATRNSGFLDNQYINSTLGLATYIGFSDLNCVDENWSPNPAGTVFCFRRE